VHTRWIETEFAGGLPPYEGPVAHGGEPAERERITVEVGGKRLEVVLPAGLAAAPAPGGRLAGQTRRGQPGRSAPRDRAASRRPGPAGAGGDALVSPMQGTIVKIVAEDGATVAAGDTVVVLEAMKMEQPLAAHKDGTVTGLAVEVGQTVSAGEVICQLKD
jgi:acetyl-CoA/propionyl-CoA carboxylase biotin carboxyl carrier protein